MVRYDVRCQDTQYVTITKEAPPPPRPPACRAVYCHAAVQNPPVPYPPCPPPLAVHYKEQECFMSIYEDVFYNAGVDVVLNGHVHAYERTHPMYKCVTSIRIGVGPWMGVQPGSAALVTRLPLFRPLFAAISSQRNIMVL